MAPRSTSASPTLRGRSRLERAARLKTRNPVPFMEISDQGLYSLSTACEFSAEDTVFDLGTGCGRIMAEILERYPCRGVAVEVNPSLARMAGEKLSKYGERVRVVAQDLRKVDLQEATAVVCFFTSVALEDLKRYLAAALSIGCVLLNYAYPVPGWWTVRPPTDGVYKYVIGEHRTKPRVEELPSESPEKKPSVVPLATLTAEAARTWHPLLGWYPFRKRASIDGPSKLLTSLRASSQSSAGSGPLSPVSSDCRSPVMSPSRRPGDNPRAGRRASDDERGITRLSCQIASHAADEDRAIEMLHRAIQGEDTRLLRDAISSGEHAGIEENLLDSARNHLLRLEALEMLMRARVSKDPQALKMAISKAEISDLPRGVIEQMKHILKGLESTQVESSLEEGAMLGMEREVASRPGCVSLPSMRRHCSAPNFFLPGVDPKQRATL